MPRKLGQQVVVFTRASSGIGCETAVELGKCGASVVLAARNETALRAAAQEVERLGGKAEVVLTDVVEWLGRRRLLVPPPAERWRNSSTRRVMTRRSSPASRCDACVRGDTRGDHARS